MYTLYNILSYSQRTGICRQLMGSSRKYAYQIFKLYNLNMLHSRKNHTYWIQIFTGWVSIGALLVGDVVAHWRCEVAANIRFSYDICMVPHNEMLWLNGH